jgi:hypothetical protein
MDEGRMEGLAERGRKVAERSEANIKAAMEAILRAEAAVARSRRAREIDRGDED